MTFPKAVYRRGTYPGQIDHPGWLSKVVGDADALEAAMAEGWHVEMSDPPKAKEPKADKSAKAKEPKAE